MRACSSILNLSRSNNSMGAGEPPPALFTSAYRPFFPLRINSSETSFAALEMCSRFARSSGQIGRRLGRFRPRRFSESAAFLTVANTRKPRFASVIADCRPIPEEHPVIRIASRSIAEKFCGNIFSFFSYFDTLYIEAFEHLRTPRLEFNFLNFLNVL